MGWAAHSHSGHLSWDYSQLLECLITPEGDKEGKDLLGKPNLGWIFGVDIIFFSPLLLEYICWIREKIMG